MENKNIALIILGIVVLGVLANSFVMTGDVVMNEGDSFFVTSKDSPKAVEVNGGDSIVFNLVSINTTSSPKSANLLVNGKATDIETIKVVLTRSFQYEGVTFVPEQIYTSLLGTLNENQLQVEELLTQNIYGYYYNENCSDLNNPDCKNDSFMELGGNINVRGTFFSSESTGIRSNKYLGLSAPVTIVSGSDRLTLWSYRGNISLTAEDKIIIPSFKSNVARSAYLCVDFTGAIYKSDVPCV